MERATLAQLSARLHGHIYRSRSCTRGRLDLIRSRQKNPIHAIEFKNIICFLYLVIFSLKLECLFRFNWFHTIYFQQKAYRNYISASYPVPSRERGTVCGCSNSCRYPICCLSLFENALFYSSTASAKRLQFQYTYLSILVDGFRVQSRGDHGWPPLACGILSSSSDIEGCRAVVSGVIWIRLLDSARLIQV